MELDLVLVRGAAVFMQKGPGEESASHGARACELARQLNRPRDLSRALGPLIVYQIGRNREAARQLAQEGFSISRRLGDPIHEAFHLAYLGLLSSLDAELSSARENCEQALAAPTSEPHSSRIMRVTKVNSLGVLCPVLWHQGFPDQALRRCREMLGMEHELSDRALFGVVLPSAANVAMLCGELELAHELVNALASVAEEQSLSFRYVAYASFYKGWLLSLENDLMEGIALIRKAMSIWDANRFSAGISFQAAILAGAYTMARQPEEGLRVIDEVLPLVEQLNDRLFEPELWRVRGELLLMRDAAAGQDAETCLRKAVALAASRNAKSLELRATMSLARLLDKRGKREEARAMLAEIYGWFTEGFTTADLNNAKALLEQLNA
jgi:adenylate cyclase